MKSFFSDALNVCKNFEISKNYDCRTEFKSSEEKEPYFILHTKGNYTVRPIHIAIGVIAVATVCLASSVSSSVKQRRCAKKG